MKNLIIDSDNLLHRIWYINKSANGNSLLMFFRTLRSYVEKFQPNCIYAAWDKKLMYPSTNFRKELTKTEYKANRDYSELKEIHAQDDLIVEMMKTLGIKVVFPRVMEGDDVIAWLSHNLPGETVIISVDQDLLQLVNNKTQIFSPIKKVLVTEQNLIEHTKVRPECFLRYKAVKGDQSDNLNGLDGFGAVKSKKLVENWAEFSHKLTAEQLQAVENNIKIVDLSYGYTVYPEEVQAYKEQLKQQENSQADFIKFKELCIANNLNEIFDEYLNWVRPFKPEKNKKIIDNYVKSIVDKLKLQYSDE